MLEHIGITINEESDIDAFYKNLLGLKEEKKFKLNDNLSDKLFGTGETVSVTLLSCEDLLIELFLTGKRQKPVYNHICISVSNSDDILKKSKSMGFPVTQIERDSKDNILFISDHSGNLFEIKKKRPLKKSHTIQNRVK